MKFSRSLGIILLSATAFSWSGCAVMFSSSRQYVSVTSSTPGAKISFNGDSVGTGSARVRLNKYRVYNMLTAEKEGYKSRSYCVTLNKYSPTLALMAIDVLPIVIPTVKLLNPKNRTSTSGTATTTYDFGGEVAIIPALGLASIVAIDLKHAKTHRYDKSNVIPALDSFRLRSADEKYLLVNNTDIDVKSKDQRSMTYSRLRKYYGDQPSNTTKSYSKEDVKISDVVFTSSVNHTLKKMKFIDTSNSIFPTIGNSLYLNATIKKVTFHEVKSPYTNTEQYHKHPESVMPNHLFAVELSIDWDILDFYKQKITTLRTVERSDLFTIPYGSNQSQISDVVYDALKDNMDYSVMNLRGQLAEKGLLKVSAEKTELTTLELSRPQQANRTKESFTSSCVAITVDDGFGSGAIISADGYIVTNYHLVAGSKKVTVTFSDTSKLEAEIVRMNTESDMALLKVKKEGLVPFALSEDKDPEIGKDVWAVGVARNLDLGVSISHGIISGVRKTNGMLMLQTDASINKGNSGSALVDDKGVAVGIVSMKMLGRGVEGLGFALSANDVLTKLKLKYK